MIHLDKGKTAKEEARESQLREEACVREKVTYIQKNLSLMLRALGEMAVANPVFAHSQLPSLVSLGYYLYFSCIILWIVELSLDCFCSRH